MYFLTGTNRGSGTLHRDGCKRVRKTTHVTSLTEQAGNLVYGPAAVTAATWCGGCMKSLDRPYARAEAWLGNLDRDRQMLAMKRAYAVKQKADREREENFLAQFEPLRVAAQAAWGQRVTINTTYDADLRLAVANDPWWEVGTFDLNVVGDDHSVTVVRMNHSTCLVMKVADAHNLSALLTVIANWRSDAALKVKADC